MGDQRHPGSCGVREGVGGVAGGEGKGEDGWVAAEQAWAHKGNERLGVMHSDWRSIAMYGGEVDYDTWLEH